MRPFLTMEYGLPRAVEIDGENYEIRTDFRVILEIFELLNDPELSDADKAEGIIEIFYLRPEDIQNRYMAISRCFSFINRGKEAQNKKEKKLLDWEKDFEYVIAPVNHILGFEARDVPYDPQTNEGGVHWWTFLSAFMEVGSNCVLSTILNIRDKQAHGKPLTKDEKKWFAKNKDLVVIQSQYSDAEEALLKEWSGGT